MISTLHVRSGQEQHLPCNFLLPFTSMLKSVKKVILKRVRGFHILTSSNMCLWIEFTHTLRINDNLFQQRCYVFISFDAIQMHTYIIIVISILSHLKQRLTRFIYVCSLFLM